MNHIFCSQHTAFKIVKTIWTKCVHKMLIAISIFSLSGQKRRSATVQYFTYFIDWMKKHFLYFVPQNWTAVWCKEWLNSIYTHFSLVWLSGRSSMLITSWIIPFNLLTWGIQTVKVQTVYFGKGKGKERGREGNSIYSLICQYYMSPALITRYDNKSHPEISESNYISNSNFNSLLVLQPKGGGDTRKD